MPWIVWTEIDRVLDCTQSSYHEAWPRHGPRINSLNLLYTSWGWQFLVLLFPLVKCMVATADDIACFSSKWCSPYICVSGVGSWSSKALVSLVIEGWSIASQYQLKVIWKPPNAQDSSGKQDWLVGPVQLPRHGNRAKGWPDIEPAPQVWGMWKSAQYQYNMLQSHSNVPNDLTYATDWMRDFCLRALPSPKSKAPPPPRF